MKQRQGKNTRELLAITPLIPHILIIAIACGIYYYLQYHHYFPEWIDYLYWTVKIVIGFEVLAAAASTLWGPIIGLISGLLMLFAEQVYDINFLTVADGWQLIIVSIIGFLITIIIKL